MKLQRRQRNIWTLSRVMLAFILLGAMASWNVTPTAAAMKIDIPGPVGSVAFGESVTVLPTGNFVVTDTTYDGGIGAEAGAVYLYNGATGALISTLTGASAGDQVGSGGITVLSNGNFVVSSPDRDNGGMTDAGAVTWGSGSIGVSGVVSEANSLVGSHTNDDIGYYPVVALSNGNYVVRSQRWDDGGTADVGAVIWGIGSSGVSGPISSVNSLVGSQANDMVGSGVTALSNGNYVVRSPYWDNGGAVNTGAVTWGNGSLGITGVVSATNSLIGSQAYDSVGYGLVTSLSNGNYVVSSYYWNNAGIEDVGAVTWGNGSLGITGVVSVTNSLVGSQADDNVGSTNVTALSNGNYVVGSYSWQNGATFGAGAATWGNGSIGTTGVVSVTNSLIGSHTYDRVGSRMVALSNGNYVLISSYWDNGAISGAGAVTWGNGSVGSTGVVSVTNSLVGSQVNDYVGDDGVTSLSNGNYVVCSSSWNNGAATKAGAATWGNGSGGTTGTVSSANSLVGSQNDDHVGASVEPLSNGNYVVSSRYWSNGAVFRAGAVTWGNGSGGTTGLISSSNSLVGSVFNDQVGYLTIALNNGNYVVGSPNWNNGATTYAGAATWGNGSGGTTGAVLASISLAGSQSNDRVGYEVYALSNGSYVVYSPYWNNGVTEDVGAVTWDYEGNGLIRNIDGNNSVIGAAVSGGISMVSAYDEVNYQLVVGRPKDNMVTLFRLPNLFLPIIKK